jgi:hypothetical protein
MRPAQLSFSAGGRPRHLRAAAAPPSRAAQPATALGRRGARPDCLRPAVPAGAPRPGALPALLHCGEVCPPPPPVTRASRLQTPTHCHTTRRTNPNAPPCPARRPLNTRTCTHTYTHSQPPATRPTATRRLRSAPTRSCGRAWCCGSTASCTCDQRRLRRWCIGCVCARACAAAVWPSRAARCRPVLRVLGRSGGEGRARRGWVGGAAQCQPGFGVQGRPGGGEHAIAVRAPPLPAADRVGGGKEGAGPCKAPRGGRRGQQQLQEAGVPPEAARPPWCPPAFRRQVVPTDPAEARQRLEEAERKLAEMDAQHRAIQRAATRWPRFWLNVSARHWLVRLFFVWGEKRVLDAATAEKGAARGR